jgi:hypothetical protein
VSYFYKHIAYFFNYKVRFVLKQYDKCRMRTVKEGGFTMIVICATRGVVFSEVNFVLAQAVLAASNRWFVGY